MTVQEVNDKLIELSEESYAQFTMKLNPDTKYKITGVRIPKLRGLAKQIAKGDLREYLRNASLTTYEHVMLYGFCVTLLKCPIEEYLDCFDKYMPLIDNWALCDCVVSGLKPIMKNLASAWEHFLPYASMDCWRRRVFAVVTLSFFIQDEYVDELLKIYATMPEGDYYADMAVAWSISVILVKYYNKAEKALREGAFGKFVTNKSIQKARESFRISAEQKEHLNKLKK